MLNKILTLLAHGYSMTQTMYTSLIMSDYKFLFGLYDTAPENFRMNYILTARFNVYRKDVLCNNNIK